MAKSGPKKNGAEWFVPKCDPRPFGMVNDAPLAHFGPLLTHLKAPPTVSAEGGRFWSNGQKRLLQKVIRDTLGW